MFVFHERKDVYFYLPFPNSSSLGLNSYFKNFVLYDLNIFMLKISEVANLIYV